MTYFRSTKNVIYDMSSRTDIQKTAHGWKICVNDCRKYCFRRTDILKKRRGRKKKDTNRINM